ncbi:MAG: glycosyltransferase [bacterium]|nr:glycosyltransferase [bacterium]
MAIEICIPAYNEERIIAESAGAVLRVLQKTGEDVAVIVADNDSTDGTASAAKGIPGVSVLSIPIRGKGAAVAAAARHSGADFFGFIDADLSADPEDILNLLPLVEKSGFDIAIGSRLIETTMVKRGAFRTLSSKAFNILRKMIVGVRSVEDTQCGLKIMNARGRKILAGCTEKGWFLDMEFLARAERAGLSIKEVPVHWNEHRFEDRKSKLVLLRDSVGALRAMFRIRNVISK